MPDDNKITLILHVGAGKTGTTSIQEMLKSGQAVLRQHGFWYLGLMLEFGPNLYSWQRPTTVNQDFHALPHNVGVEQLTYVLRQVVAEAKKNAIHTLLWSNESLFDRNTQVLEALLRFQDELEIRVVAYIRRHDSWARSAYLQWGLKHKTYSGKIKPFKEWVAGGAPKFADKLKAFDHPSVGSLIVRNLDAVKDSVSDYFRLIGSPELDPPRVRLNERMGPMEVFFRALVNDNFRQPVLPSVFERVLGKNPLPSGTPTVYLNQLLPTSADMAAVRAQCEEDRNKVNKILTDNDQPPLEDGDIETESVSVDYEELALCMSRLLVAQAVRLERLERAVNELTNTLAADKARQ